MFDLLKKGPLHELYNVIFYTVLDWADCGWLGGAVNSSKNPKQLVTGFTIHRLTGRKDVTKMLQKINSAASYSNIIQQNKIWANMAVSSKPVTKNLKIQKMV